MTEENRPSAVQSPVPSEAPKKEKAPPKSKRKKVSKKAKPKKLRTATAKGRPAKFPRHSVAKALRIPKAILEQNAGRPSSIKQAADFLGMKATGPFHLEVSSATKYGLLDRLDNGEIKPSELAKRIIRPQAENDEQGGFRQAVLQAPDISEVYAHYRGENLPDLQFLRNTVVDNYGIPLEKFDEFYEIFIESLRTAGLLEQHGDNARVLDVTDDRRQGDAKSDRIKKLERVVKVDESQTCFVMQPFSEPLGQYYDKLYRPAIEKAGLKPVRADADIFGTGKIVDQVWRGINQASVLVAELTSRNPNVYYELGLAHALEKPVVLISSNESDVPFDLKHIRVIYYDTSDPFWGTKLIEKVAENILSALKNPEEAIFKKWEG